MTEQRVLTPRKGVRGEIKPTAASLWSNPQLGVGSLVGGSRRTIYNLKDQSYTFRGFFLKARMSKEHR